MENQKLISFDLKSEFGFLKKPDINDIYLTYNMLHKPALLGILGAVIGLRGYTQNGELPEYYKRLKHLDVGIKPLNDDKGMFIKSMLTYNNGIGFASNESGGNLIITEQFLIKPAYRCYLMLNLNKEDEKVLYDNLRLLRAEFLPYLGKNDFSAWWSDFREYDNVEFFHFQTDYKIDTIFSKTEAVNGYIPRLMSMFSSQHESIWTYFERLPIGFDETLYQYNFGDFVYSNATFKKEMDMSSAGRFYSIGDGSIIQLF